VQEKDTLLKTSQGVLPSKCPPVAQEEMSNREVDSLALWKIINEENAVLIPPKFRGEDICIGFLQSEFFGTG